MLGLVDENGGSERTSTHFLAVLPDPTNSTEADWKNATCDILPAAGGNPVQVTNFKAARLPFVERTTLPRRFRYVVIAEIPGSLVDDDKIRITLTNGTVTTAAGNRAPTPALPTNPATLSYANGTYTHNPGMNAGSHWIIGIWPDQTKNLLGWKPIPRNVSATTAEDATDFAPAANLGKPTFATCVEVANVRTGDVGFNALVLRLASVVVV